MRLRRIVPLLVIAMLGAVGPNAARAGYVFTTIDVPGASNIYAYGINAAGQIVGGFADNAGGHGFLATPQAVPEPSTLALGIIGTMVLLGNAWHRRRSPTI
jgi:probable HAF family extracellular repeat protein